MTIKQANKKLEFYNRRVIITGKLISVTSKLQGTDNPAEWYQICTALNQIQKELKDLWCDVKDHEKGLIEGRR